MNQKSQLGDLSSTTEIRLKRVLTLYDLIIYGIILIQPIAAAPLFGIISKLSLGNSVTPLFVSMIAMIFTAISYGKMANRYPAAGSAYTYVGRGLNPYPGFIAGWSMFLDYLVIPILCTIFVSLTAERFFPAVPYSGWIIILGGSFTILNLNGIKTTTRSNMILLGGMMVVIAAFMAATIRYAFISNGLMGGVFSTKPFYNPETFSWSVIGTGTSVAALTYIGFDGLTTLSEEVENPRRNVLLATVLTCLITGLLSGSQIYLAQLAWPDYNTFPQIETAFMDAAGAAGGTWLFNAVAVTLFVGSYASGYSGQTSAARLLYGMGRDNILPRGFFAHLDKKHHGPSYNIILIGILVVIGATFLDYQLCAELINFGAFLAFMGVNLAAIREYYFKAEKKTLRIFFINFVSPLVGFLICFWIWLNLSHVAQIIGGCWLLFGLLYLAVKTKGFREKLVQIDFSEST